MTDFMIPLGRFFFKTRNLLFPLLVLTLFALLPPAKTILGSAQTESQLDATAITLIALGVLIRLMVIGFVKIPRDGDKKTAGANELFTKGMFGISRNSLYLGNLTIYTGVFMLHGTWLVFLLGTGIFLFIYYSIIFSEEAFLKGKFGEAFTAYTQSVPRLLPRLSNWKASTQGMDFSWKQAVYAEYNIIAQAIIMVALALWYESYGLTASMVPPITVVALLVFTLGFALAIRTYRR